MQRNKETYAATHPDEEGRRDEVRREDDEGREEVSKSIDCVPPAMNIRLTGMIQPNTLEEAVEVLNKKKHRGDFWLKENNSAGNNVAKAYEHKFFLTEFEAIAIARAYFDADLMK